MKNPAGMINGRHFGAEFARLAKSTAPNEDEPASPVPNRRGDIPNKLI